jgi:hypothetical protein
VTYIAFSNEQKAVEFERYLKSASGRAFAKKRYGLDTGFSLYQSTRLSPYNAVS